MHHVVAQGNNRAPIVVDDVDRRALLARLRDVVAARLWRVQAYCLLDTHLHFVVQTPKPDLGAGLQRLLGGYARRFNLRHGREGHLFRSPCFSRPVAADGHLVRSCVYVAVNPVAAGVSAAPEGWRWSSYAETVGEVAPSGLVDPGLLLGVFHADPERARALYRETVAAAAREHHASG